MKTLLVTGCSDAAFWYAAHVGKLFDPIWMERDRYWTREPAGYSNFILKADCQLIEVAHANQ